jgi:hypothetical protein
MSSSISDIDNHERLELLEPKFKEKAIAFWTEIASEGLPFKVFETVRSFQQQDLLFMKGRAVDVINKRYKVVGKVVTGAKPGRSPHNWGMAFDGVLDLDSSYWDELHELPPIEPQGMWDDGRNAGKNNRIKAAWKAYGVLAEEHGLTWGGRFTFVDMPHVEDTDWRKLVPKDWRNKVLQQAGQLQSLRF